MDDFHPSHACEALFPVTGSRCDRPSISCQNERRTVVQGESPRIHWNVAKAPRPSMINSVRSIGTKDMPEYRTQFNYRIGTPEIKGIFSELGVINPFRTHPCNLRVGDIPQLWWVMGGNEPPEKPAFLIEDHRTLRPLLLEHRRNGA